jgi:LysR family glycine cleavage system transcriptional activator
MAVRHPPISALVGFEAAARLGSFTRAAAEVCLTQGAVSRQVQLLESFCGVPLLERTRQGLRLTDAGRGYLEEVRPLLQRLQLATDRLRTHQGRAGVLHLSVPPSFGSYWLVPRLPQFIAAHPEVALHLSTQVGPMPDLRYRGLDAAILYTAEPPEGCAGQTVLPLTLHAYAAPALLRAVAGEGAARVCGLPLLQSSTLLAAWPQWLQAAGVDAARCRYGPQFELLSHGLEAAIAGVGVALLPEWVTADAVRTRRLQRVSRQGITTQASYQLCCAAQRAGTAPMRTLHAWLAGLPRRGG